MFEDPAGLGDDCIEQKFVVFAVNHYDRGPDKHRIPGFCTRLGLPAAGQQCAELLNLLRVVVGGRAGETHFLPVQRRRQLRVPRHQPRRFGVVQVGHDEHGCRMLEQAIRELLEAEPDILEADLLGDDQHRKRRELAVGAAHDARDHRAIAHARIEYADRRRSRSQQRHLMSGAAGDRGLFVAGVDEREILLAIVVEPKWRRAIASRTAGFAGWRGRPAGCR